MPQPSHSLGPQRAAPPPPPLGAGYRVGVINADMSGMPATCNVDIGGDNQGQDFDSGITWPCAYVNEYTPVAGDTVVLLGRPGAYVVLGCLNGLGPTHFRYTWSRVASVVANAYIDCGTPPTVSGWCTGSLVGSAPQTSRILFAKRCRVDLYVSWNAFFNIQMSYTIGSPVSAWPIMKAAETQGGGIYKGAIQFSQVVENGDYIDMQAREFAGTSNTMTFKGFLTLSDAYAPVFQA